MVIIWHCTETPWPFIPKVVAAGSRKFCLEAHYKFYNLIFLQRRVAKYVLCGLKCSNSILKNCRCVAIRRHCADAPWQFISKFGAAEICQFCTELHVHTKNRRTWYLPMQYVQICFWWAKLFIYNTMTPRLCTEINTTYFKTICHITVLDCSNIQSWSTVITYGILLQVLDYHNFAWTQTRYTKTCALSQSCDRLRS